MCAGSPPAARRIEIATLSHGDASAASFYNVRARSTRSQITSLYLSPLCLCHDCCAGCPDGNSGVAKGLSTLATNGDKVDENGKKLSPETAT